MSSLKVTLGILAAAFMLSGCIQSTHFEATNTQNFKPKDKELLAKIRYENTPVAEPFRRAIVDYHRKELPGSIVVDSDNHYLYYVMDGGKAIRYGITVGEEAMAWSGIAKVGSMTEWPAWHPTPGEISRLGVPTFVAPGPDNPMGSRALYLYSGGKDTLFRIHGTNQPEYIGASISSGCIRLTNEDAIDLYIKSVAWSSTTRVTLVEARLLVIDVTTPSSARAETGVRTCQPPPSFLSVVTSPDSDFTFSSSILSACERREQLLLLRVDVGRLGLLRR